MKLSIIVPVYNARNSISHCLDSILEQQVPDMEIICVDDGATDGSGELLDEYAAKNSCIQVIHQENRGLVQARKTGVLAAKGEYIGYVDSDDWIEAEMYGVLCNIANQYEADMVCSGLVWEKGGMIERYYDGFPEGFYQKGKLENIREQTFFCEKNRDCGIRPSLCGKLFRSSILKKVQLTVPDEISLCEDRLCTVAYMLEVKSVYILKKAFYHYVFRSVSMSHCENVFYLDSIAKVYRAFRDMYRHPAFSENLRKQCQLYIIKMVLEGLNEHMGFPVRDMMWLHLKWIGQFPEKSRIVLYGAGRLGMAYYRQMSSDPTARLQLAAWLDRNYQNLTGYPHKIDSPESIKTVKYDYVLLALVDRQSAMEAKEYLTKGLGVAQGKIVWLEQHEIFWEYAEAAGMLKGGS